ncbi:transcriptional regulator [Apilactobacillus timberlakei]|uniref:transcriptional regulator n=1 Tax=Apilactobacillus timberlakei TaxID=2008380 RepID=UPI001129D161|nr:transcriptional regulator [Apilactobacillus timberlakei]TPR12247.1 transcriptional regulator [Apilactobacillus timberlakei]
MKKITLILSSLLLLFILTGCGSNSAAENSNNSNSKSTQQSSNSSDDSSDSSNLDNYDDLSSSDVNNKDYETGITYDEVARKPDSYKYKNVSFSGTVLQVIDDDKETQLRVAVNGDSSNVIFVYVRNENLHGSRILEDDNVTLYGQSSDLVKYKSSMNTPITIPSMLAYKIDDSGKSQE